MHLFRRLVFAQVLLGVMVFSIAERNPLLMLLAGSLTSLSWYVSEGPGGRGVPAWMVYLAVTAALAWLLIELFDRQEVVMVAMGHFVMALQVIMLYARKGNREYGQLLVLSLLLMVAAVVLSETVLVGGMMVGYCALSLFTVLLLHLKMSNDMVLERNTAAAPPGTLTPRPAPVAGPGHRAQFRGSGVLIGLLCALLATLAFLGMPRSYRLRTSSDLIAPLTQQQAGLSTEVRLRGDAPPVGQRDAILRVTFPPDTPTPRAQGTLLRGTTMDLYDAVDHTWVRGQSIARFDRQVPAVEHHVVLSPPPPANETLRVEVLSRVDTGPDAFVPILSPGPPTSVEIDTPPAVVYNPLDARLMAQPMGQRAMRYRVSAAPGSGVTDLPPLEGYARGWRVQTARVSGLAQSIIAPLGLARNPSVQHDPADEAIALALTRWLAENGVYDTENPTVGAGEDPIVHFLFTTRRGHCELFAAGLAAMTRSLGMSARLVTGYRVSEFNRVGGYYVVRPAHAHAWVEVDLGPGRGWSALDPTPAEAVQREHEQAAGALRWLADVYEAAEFLWLARVIRYDHTSREELIDRVQAAWQPEDAQSMTVVQRVVAWLRELPQYWRYDRLSLSVAVTIAAFILLGLTSLTRILVLRRRRLTALQLARLPRPERITLVRHLRFYLVMLDLLERHGQRRPRWQTPFDFAQSLAEHDPMRFDPVVALTEVFYAIRFGGRRPDTGERTVIQAHLDQLAQNLLGRDMK